jgi:hypothetical protein
MEREAIIDAIEAISQRLKGSGISYLERLLLHEDRKDLRAKLSAIDEIDFSIKEDKGDG